MAGYHYRGCCIGGCNCNHTTPEIRFISVPTTNQEILDKYNAFIAASRDDWTPLLLNSKTKRYICSCHFERDQLNMPIKRLSQGSVLENDPAIVIKKSTHVRKPGAVPTILNPISHPPPYMDLISAANTDPDVAGVPGTSTCEKEGKKVNLTLSKSAINVIDLLPSEKRTAHVQVKPRTSDKAIQCDLVSSPTEDSRGERNVQGVRRALIGPDDPTHASTPKVKVFMSKNNNNFSIMEPSYSYPEIRLTIDKCKGTERTRNAFLDLNKS